MVSLTKKGVFSLLALLILLSLVVSACQPSPAAPAAPVASPTPLPMPATPVPTKEAAAPTEAPAPTEAVAEEAAGGYVNAFGVTLPPDAAPPEQQYLRVMVSSGQSIRTLDFVAAVYARPNPPWQTFSTPLIQPDKNFELLKQNPNHPSLHFKRIGRFWSVRVGLKYRALAVEGNAGLVWFWIGPHGAYDNLIKD